MSKEAIKNSNNNLKEENTIYISILTYITLSHHELYSERKTKKRSVKIIMLDIHTSTGGC